MHERGNGEVAHQPGPEFPTRQDAELHPGGAMMNGKECRATRREIDESELNQKLGDQARAHMALCASCRKFCAERTSLRELVGSLEPVAAPGDFDLRLRARLANERQGRARQPFAFRFVIGTPAIIVAALLVMLAVALVWFAQKNQNQAPAIAADSTRQEPALPNQSRLASNRDERPVQTSEVLSPPVVDPKPTGRQNRQDNNYKEINSKSAGGSVRDAGVLPAQSIKQIEQRAGEVSLSAPLKPMVVSMEDDPGATRTISLPPVSFGAQRMVDNRTPLSFSSNSRSW